MSGVACRHSSGESDGVEGHKARAGFEMNVCTINDPIRYTAILDMWSNMLSINDIAAELDISPKTVENYVTRAKAHGDPRAYRPWKRKEQAQKEIRTSIILQRAEKGLTSTQIAMEIGCRPRLVQRRLKERRAV